MSTKREVLPLYDAMVRLFTASMPNDKIGTQLLAHILNIPKGTIKKVLTVCPLPNGVKLIRGGHRGLEWFLTQDTYTAANIRAELVEAIKKEAVWAEYGVTLRPRSDEIIKEVEKVIDHIKTIKGSNIKKQTIIKNGDPNKCRVIWFPKDIINGEWYHTIHQAVGKTSKVKLVTPAKKPILDMPKLAPSSPEQWAEYKSKKQLPALAMEKYGIISDIINFVIDIQGIISSKEQYLAVIKNMEDKINHEYPALIAQKEREKAEAVREVELLKDRLKILNNLNENQKVEIANLKRHPKFAGFVERKKA